MWSILLAPVGILIFWSFLGEIINTKQTTYTIVDHGG